MTLWNRKYTYDLVKSLSIVIIPFLLSLHLLFDDIDGQRTFSILGIQFRHYFINDQVFIWSILVRLIPILLFLLWFLTSSYRWRYFILLPLSPFVLSFFDAIIKGGLNIYQSVLTVLIFIIILLLLDNKIRRKFILTQRFNESQKISLSKNYKSFYYRLKYFFDKNLKSQSQYETKDQVKKLQNLKTILDRKFIEQNILGDYSRLDKSTVNFICILLCLIPLLFYIHLLIPKGKTLLDIGITSISSNGFRDVSTFIWYMNLKICIIISISIWFVTCFEWWRYSILCPIILFTYQLWEVLKADVILIDEDEYIESLPYIFIVLLVLFFLSNSIKYQAKIMDLYDEICHEIALLLEQYSAHNSQLASKILEFSNLKDKGNSVQNAGDHLEKLIYFKEELLRDLKNSKTM